MTGKLTDAYMDQLETWIGTGPKTFALLYSITRDGCDATTFHQKCDNEGPTVTVLYNQGSVYGGYTSVSWTSKVVWIKDENAFLYQLVFSGNKRHNKFPSKQQSSNIIFHADRYGPLFGGGHALHTFSGTIESSGGYFALNGNMNGFGKDYENRGITSDKVNNGNMNVTELEVYKVTDGTRQKPNVQPHISPQKTQKPWRKTPELNDKYLAKVMEEIENIKPMSDVDITEFRILMLGPVGSGKSSFYNTIDSIFRGRISHKATCGSANHSTTTAYTPYEVRTNSGSTLKFLLCDTRGLEETQGPDVLECNFLIDGHVPDFYEFNPSNTITIQSPEFVLKPTLNERIHCVAIFLDASTVNDVSTKMIEKINNFRTIMNQRKIPQAILLTNVDKISESVRENATHVFKSNEVEQAVDNVAGLFGLPRNSIFPVKNYENELHLDDNVSIVALMALQHLLYMAEDYTDILSTKRRRVQRTPPRGSGDQEVTESDTA